MMTDQLIQNLKNLQTAKGEGTSLISYYVPGNTQIWLVTSLLNSELSTSGNIKSKHVRKNVRYAIKSIQNKLKNRKTIGEKGLVIFAGNFQIKDSYIWRK